MAEVVAVRVQAILPTKQVDYTPELATVSLELHVVDPTHPKEKLEEC